MTKATIAAAMVAGALLLSSCDGGTDQGTPTDSDGPTAGVTTAPDGVQTSDDPAATTQAPAPLMDPSALTALDEGVAAEAHPIASATGTIEGIPGEATVDVLELRATGDGGYLLRFRLGWGTDTRLGPDPHRSFSLDKEQTFIDGVRLVDDQAEAMVLPIVYAPMKEHNKEGLERYRCLCSPLPATIPADGLILSAVYGTFPDDESPESLTLQIPGFQDIKDVAVQTG